MKNRGLESREETLYRDTISGLRLNLNSRKEDDVECVNLREQMSFYSKKLSDERKRRLDLEKKHLCFNL